jgi:hypothetical protein
MAAIVSMLSGELLNDRETREMPFRAETSGNARAELTSGRGGTPLGV